MNALPMDRGDLEEDDEELELDDMDPDEREELHRCLAEGMATEEGTISSEEMEARLAENRRRFLEGRR